MRTVWFWFGRWGCRVFCILFFKLRACGRENIPRKGAFLLVGNHQSYLDPIFCGVPLRRQLFYLARESLFANWFLGWVITSVKTIPVKRGQADIHAIRKVVGILRDGAGVCVFPEGTRSSDGKITALKGGFGLLCRRGDAPIVPVVVDGAFESWPRHRKLFSPGAHIFVCYGKPISTDQAKKMTDSELTQLVTDTLRRMQNDCRIKHGKQPYDY
ncbi:MAG TPA: lysophospholipid acyltransferase family protein [Sedimentisphaerales bacterium]|nr:lysophospholipid acyltransferase family protein [Sedimentisphaerales bacterium]